VNQIYPLLPIFIGTGCLALADGTGKKEKGFSRRIRNCEQKSNKIKNKKEPIFRMKVQLATWKRRRNKEKGNCGNGEIRNKS